MESVTEIVFREGNMPITTVYFASNRTTTGPTTQWQSYGTDIVAPADANLVRYAVAFVDGIDLNAEGSGAITAIENDRLGDFNDEVKLDIVGSGKNLLVFIHGFANSFKDGITRAAFNREWLAASRRPEADTTVIAFSWPSLGQLIAAPPHLLPDDYLRDQTKAGQSGFHIANFLGMLQPLVTQIRDRGRRTFLLAHSMGNFALQAAIESWFVHANPATNLFDEVFLAAADERFDTFAFPAGARLSLLKELGSRISIYYSVRDVAMYLSFGVNLIRRLGHEGPQHKADQTEFNPALYRILNCAEVGDYSLLDPPDASHQYYRRSKRIRDDFAAAMSRDPAVKGGLITF
jgi:esterase/lipase superfamily enzyme